MQDASRKPPALGRAPKPVLKLSSGFSLILPAVGEQRACRSTQGGGLAASRTSCTACSKLRKELFVAVIASHASRGFPPPPCESVAAASQTAALDSQIPWRLAHQHLKHVVVASAPVVFSALGLTLTPQAAAHDNQNSLNARPVAATHVTHTAVLRCFHTFTRRPLLLLVNPLTTSLFDRFASANVLFALAATLLFDPPHPTELSFHLQLAEGKSMRIPFETSPLLTALFTR
ncbi:hypothetical protein AOQ84DRAFT_220676 [Glonium stellatum]|uniref:Uncharacterized protein n=1 Tax=Glonium stellatum TaxID=574774 RepID=A0A8E2EM65_9PEZI|nr:hypothetical protein AOQ84DRAFT_220676 [Glonium stellatum]